MHQNEEVQPSNDDDKAGGKRLINGSNEGSDNYKEENSATEDDPAGTLLQQWSHLQKLRELERLDEAARAAGAGDDDENDSDEASSSSSLSHITLPCRDNGNDGTPITRSGVRVLSYPHYLKSQRFYDDLKHVDYKFIDFGKIGPGELIIEQDKALGKGGLCWDAAFILGHHLIDEADEWKTIKHSPMRDSNLLEDAGIRNSDSTTFMVDLGCGTGLCGLMVAKAVSNVHVSLTDLPTLMPLLHRNVSRNFHPRLVRMNHPSSRDVLSDGDDQLLKDYHPATAPNAKDSACENGGTVAPFVLDWSTQTGSDSNSAAYCYDVIVGADVVATLYDPVALACTIHSVAHGESIVYISFKERLSSIHEQFEEEMKHLFSSFEIISPKDSLSDRRDRNRNPSVKILIARGKLESI